jgi:hypothetical protein
VFFPLDAYAPYEDGTECSETSAHKIKTLGNHPKERIQHPEHDASLKSRFKSFEMRRCFIRRVVLDVSKDFIAVGMLASEDEGTMKPQYLLAQRQTAFPRKLEYPAAPL